MKKFLKFMFSFGEKYRKREEKYARDSRKFGTSGDLFVLIILAVIPVLSLWGLFSDIGMWKIPCILGVTLILYSPPELMITGIVALRHRARMKIQNKVEGALIGKTAEMIAGEKMSEADKEQVENYEAKGTAHKYDLAVGILGITLSIAAVIAFAVMLGVLGWRALQTLQA